jgi:hypothetical protein
VIERGRIARDVIARDDIAVPEARVRRLFSVDLRFEGALD